MSDPPRDVEPEGGQGATTAQADIKNAAESEADLGGGKDAEKGAGEKQSAETSVPEGIGLGLDGVPTQHEGSVQPMKLLDPISLAPHPAEALHAPDSPTTSLISVLREQLKLVSDQSYDLNQKLVESISRHADLLDQHELLSSQHKSLQEKAGGLEKDVKQWEESMNTGLFVERSQITGEMQRLAAGLVEEERRRGSAEERRRKVEDEVDELAASLFGQANTMVAQERHGRIEAETRLKSTEDNLAAAEAAMRDMQLHLQSMPVSAAITPAPEPGPSSLIAIKRKYLISHQPYSEFLSFLSHLRLMRPIRDTNKNILPPPLISALLTQAFIARLAAEDHDPTLRLDVAPDLSWLSRRGVSSAIITGDLIIEPVPASSVLAASGVPAYDIGCSLCGKPVFPATTGPGSPNVSHFGQPPLHPTQRNSSSRFSLKPFFNATSPSSVPSPNQSPAASPGPGAQLGPVYIFRVSKPPPLVAGTTTVQEKEKENKAYPLCRTGWCLERLRATCELWRFLRTGVIQVVWHGDDGHVSPSDTAHAGSTAVQSAAAESEKDQRRVSNASNPASASMVASSSADTAVPPELPPRRKSGWGLGFKLSDKSGSSGWTKAFRGGTGASNSPPVSPKIPPGELEKPLPVVQDPREAKDNEAKTDDLLESLIERERGGGEKDGDEKDGVAGSDGKDDARGSGEIDRVRSSLSLDSTGEKVEFSTPQQASPDLPTETAAAVPVPNDPSSTAGENIDRPQTPVKSSATNEVDLTSPNRSTADAPPVPRRSTARNRASLEGSGTATPAETEAGVASEEKAPEPENAPSAPSEPSIEASHAESTEVATTAPRQSQDSNPGEIPHSAKRLSVTAPPPLPMRHPRTPTMQIRPETTDGQKAFMKAEDETWEGKTWREVVRLKEDMWRTRVGITEEI